MQLAVKYVAIYVNGMEVDDDPDEVDDTSDDTPNDPTVTETTVESTTPKAPSTGIYK